MVGSVAARTDYQDGACCRLAGQVQFAYLSHAIVITLKYIIIVGRTVAGINRHFLDKGKKVKSN